MSGIMAEAATLPPVAKRNGPSAGPTGIVQIEYARSLATNLGSTPRWVWIAVAVMAIAAVEYLMGLK
jgi:hypothetical protein